MRNFIDILKLFYREFYQTIGDAAPCTLIHCKPNFSHYLGKHSMRSSKHCRNGRDECEKHRPWLQEALVLIKPRKTELFKVIPIFQPLTSYVVDSLVIDASKHGRLLHNPHQPSLYHLILQIQLMTLQMQLHVIPVCSLLFFMVLRGGIRQFLIPSATEFVSPKI